jgi:YtkA-like
MRTAISVMLGTLTVAVLVAACGGDTKQTELHRVKSGALEVVLLSPREALVHGKDDFTIEFRSAADGALVDVGSVRVNATMPMPGMPMLGSIDVKPTGVAGRYAASGAFEMAGTWRMTIQWEGPAGTGSVTFPGSVQ